MKGDQIMKNYLRMGAEKVVEFAVVPGNYERVAKWSCIGTTVLASAWLASIIGYVLIH
jgi:hypothetical protein